MHYKSETPEEGFIKYPYAMEKETGNIIHIEDANPKKKYECLDCRESMIPKALTSEYRQPHFSHPPDIDMRCEESPEHFFITSYDIRRIDPEN